MQYAILDQHSRNPCDFAESRSLMQIAICDSFLVAILRKVLLQSFHFDSCEWCSLQQSRPYQWIATSSSAWLSILSENLLHLKFLIKFPFDMIALVWFNFWSDMSQQSPMQLLWSKIAFLECFGIKFLFSPNI